MGHVLLMSGGLGLLMLVALTSCMALHERTVERGSIAIALSLPFTLADSKSAIARPGNWCFISSKEGRPPAADLSSPVFWRGGFRPPPRPEDPSACCDICGNQQKRIAYAMKHSGEHSSSKIHGKMPIIERSSRFGVYVGYPVRWMRPCCKQHLRLVTAAPLFCCQTGFVSPMLRDSFVV